MRSLREYINLIENTAPLLFHGTNSLERLLSIKENGLRPERSNYTGALKAMAGHVYLTSSFYIASDYAHRNNDTDSIYIAVFSPPPRLLPDEDSVVAFVQTHSSHEGEFVGRNEDRPTWEWLKAAGGMPFVLDCYGKRFSKAVAAAKRLIKQAPLQVLQHLVAETYKFAVPDAVHPLACYQVKKSDLRMIGSDGAGIDRYGVEV